MLHSELKLNAFHGLFNDNTVFGFTVLSWSFNLVGYV